jgi:uncharacterized membrane protein
MEFLELAKLSGVVIVVVGLVLKLNPLLVVLAAGVVTGLVSNMSLVQILEAIGNAFVTNRAMSILILILPVVGLCERFGLREQAEFLIKKLTAATSGRILTLYLLLRQVTMALGLNLGGHPAMIRPLISPMAEAAAEKDGVKVSEATIDKIRGLAASADNMGNFFGQLVFPATGGVIYIFNTMENANIKVDPIDIALWAIPTAIAAFFVAAIRYWLLDKEITKELESLKGGEAR